MKREINVGSAKERTLLKHLIPEGGENLGKHIYGLKRRGKIWIRGGVKLLLY